MSTRVRLTVYQLDRWQTLAMLLSRGHIAIATCLVVEVLKEKLKEM